MSRNLWLNISIALALVLIAAFAGQLHKWQKNRPARQTSDASRPLEDASDAGADEAGSLKTEILVRFKPGITRQAIEAITQRLNDDVEDRIEAVEGLSVIEDEDNRSADEVVAQYRMLSEVEYAETNIQIKLDHEGAGKHIHANDELFYKQWGLFNHGQDGGKAGADISAMQAWATTKGSSEVVVAVLDSGIDAGHPDLAGQVVAAANFSDAASTNAVVRDNVFFGEGPVGIKDQNINLLVPGASTGQIADKLSFVVSLDKWHWVVGTGVYLDDVFAQSAAANKVMLHIDRFDVGQSYVTAKIENRHGDIVKLNIQGGQQGIELQETLFKLQSRRPKFAYLTVMLNDSGKILVRKLPVIGIKDWLLIYEDDLFLLAVKDAYDELDIRMVD